MLNSFEVITENTLDPEFRKNHIGCSDIGAILNISPFKSAYILMLEKCGYIKPPERTEAMLRGIALEATARDLFIEKYGIPMKDKAHSYKKWPILCASYDGISPDNKVLLEIKCPSSPVLYEQAKEKYIPEYYFVQMQFQLLVSSAEICYYMVYVNHKEYQLIEVVPDYKYIEDNFYKLKEFWDMKQNKQMPKRIDSDPLFLMDDEIKDDILELKEAIEEHNKVKEMEKQAKDKRKEIELKFEKYVTEKKVIFGTTGVKATVYSGRETVNWNKYKEDFNIDNNILNNYRNKSEPYILFKI